VQKGGRKTRVKDDGRASRARRRVEVKPRRKKRR